ncbi:MAG: sugar phosphate isomerase/epimerase [Planctomycetales bacterium]|nr:sugar phosphate isomerase/epimerase [Planctomycetales bacterium]
MTNITRRQFLTTAASVATAVAFADDKPAPTKKTKLGIDNFAVRGMEWKAPQLIDYAVSLKTDSLFISDLDAFESHDETYLRGLRSKAADQGLQLHVGTWSICPTSVRFKNKWGTAEEHLRLGIHIAKAVGSPVIRVILGGGDDRMTPGGIMARIKDTVPVLKACRGQAIDAGVKIAVENHGGDMQAWELVELIEAAGKDFVGANMDSGNATWTMEDPLTSLEQLGPYALTTSLRDSAVWESEKGATVQWTAMGDGTTDLKTYFQRFAELCPGVPVHIETISGFNREFPYLTDGFWKPWPNARAKDFARFVALAKRGKPRPPHVIPDGQDKKTREQEYQRAEVERSIKYCKEVLGLGQKN